MTSRRWGPSNPQRLPLARTSALAVLLLLVTTAGRTFAEEATTTLSRPGTPITFTLGKTFTFLFVTLGPLKVFGPFASMTRGQDKAFKRKLALTSSAIAATSMIIATTLGARILSNWGISTETLLLTAGVVLFLVALGPVLKQYAAREPERSAESVTPPSGNCSALAFSPLAFPTIVTPYGIATLIVLVRLRATSTTVAEILGLTALVLALDLLAMLFADRILKAPAVVSALAVVGAVMGVLQVALGIQIVVVALRLLLR